MPGVDLPAYKRTLIERFSNPEVRDTIARLCAESSDRIPKWLLPVVRHQLASGGEITALGRDRRQLGALRRRESTSRAGRSRWSTGSPTRLTESARRQREDPDAFIANRDVFGDLADDPRFTAAYRAALRRCTSAAREPR